MEGVQAGCKETSRDEVFHIGMLRRRLAQSLSHLRNVNGQRRPVKPTATNIAKHVKELEDADVGMAEGPITDESLARGPNPEAAGTNISRVCHPSLLQLIWNVNVQSLCISYQVHW
jgi:hypothetical protein